MKKLGKLKLNPEKLLQGYNSTTIWYLDCLQEGHAGCDALAC
jgi:hypothetical protein